MEWAPAEPDDMVELFQYLSELHKHEITECANANGVSEEDVRNMVGLWVDKCGAWTARDKFGRVLCMVSIAPAIPGTENMWLFATRAFFDHTAANMRDLRRRFDLMVNQTHRRYSTLTFSKHPKAGQWARALGFNEVREDGSGLRFTRTR